MAIASTFIGHRKYLRFFRHFCSENADGAKCKSMMRKTKRIMVKRDLSECRQTNDKKEFGIFNYSKICR